MGNILRRGVKNFNVENRAHRVLDRHPKAAPKHPVKDQDVSKPALPEIETFQRKDKNLLTMLQTVNVDSTGKDPVEDNRARLLPVDRKRKEEQTEFWSDSDTAPEGRITVSQALQMLANHQRNSKEWPVERLAQEYKLNPLDAKNIVEYFQSFKVIPIGPKDGENVSSLPPGISRSKLIT